MFSKSFSNVLVVGSTCCYPPSIQNFQMELSISSIFALYTSNLLWSLFLTSTALHAIALITSPMQAVLKWYRRQSSDSDTCLPYLCAVIGSGLWLRYSIFIQDTKLILLQTYAVIMQSFFLIALIFYRSKKRRLIRLVILIATVIFLVFYYIQGMNEDDGKQATGSIASAAQIAGSLVCPYLIYKAVSSRCIDFVPLAPVAFTWIMELHAIIYSIGLDDFYMLLANTIFFCMDGSLLAMFFVFPTEKPKNCNVQTS
ncbi:Sugar transporter SWEET [Trichostrongylus colubriformis]|uniref:Sugar transporter SWEET n=1 Tax=Trichostrongylus colubriformis TaxID=6319 RepID=A0AAN8IN09_TRICO